MVPESKSAFAVTLYKAEKFPREWRPVKTLIKGNFSDPSVFRHNDYWWIFVSETNDILRLFFQIHFRVHGMNIGSLWWCGMPGMRVLGKSLLLEILSSG